MKKTRLLTGIVALALVVGLGACEINGDINIGVGDGSESTGDTTTEDDDGGDTGTGDDGAGDDGDGDNDDGDGAGDDGDDGDDEGGSSEDPDLVIAEEILDVAASTQYLEWDALEATEYTDGEVTAEVLLALDDNEKGYGYWYQYDEYGDPDTYNYYVEGTKYVYDPNEDEGDQYYIASYGGSIDLDTFLDDYGEILEDAEDIDLADQDTTYSLEATGEGYSLSVTVSSLSVYNTELTYRYTFVVDSNDTIVGLGFYGPDNAVGLSYSGFSASESTYAAVASAMAEEFDINNWISDTSDLQSAIDEFTLRGSDYNYGDGFSYQSIDYSTSYYYNTECVATSNDNGYYIAESLWGETYYAYGAYSNGSNTWSYDSDDGCEDVGYLYFSYTLFTLQTVMSFAYTDFEEIIEGLTSFVGNDLDTDVLVTDELIYVWTSNEDEEQAVLYAEYEDNALSLLVYEYAGLSGARAVMLTPYEGTVDVPEWVEIDEGEGENQGETYEGNPVADLLADVKTNNNYTLTIEYNDWTSPTYGSEDEMYQDFYNGTISQNSQRLYDVDITFTEDVMFIEYYYGTHDGSVYDIESYINNGDDMEVWWCSTSYSTTLVKQTSMTESSQSWQTKWENETLLGLNDNLFSVNASSYDGTKVDYTATIDSYDTLTALVDCLYHCANYYAEGSYASNITPFIYNLQPYWNTYGAPYVDSTYYFATQEWITSTYYLEESVTPTGSGNDYQLKYHGVTAYVSSVGSTQLADIYASQLPIYSN